MYKIVFTKQVVKPLQGIPRDAVGLIQVKLDEIANNPFASHPNTTKLQGRPGYRPRVGDWRVIYEIETDEALIIVLKIALRSEVYR